MKDSRFGYSTLTREESRRFQTAAYTYGQFQTLFGIDCEANVQPWEYSSESVPNGQITPRAFLDSLSTPQLRQLATFKDFVLPWTDSLCVDSFIHDVSDLSKGKHTNRNRDRMSNLRSLQNITVISFSLAGWTWFDVPLDTCVSTLNGLSIVFRIITQARNFGLRTIWSRQSLPEQTLSTSQIMEN